MQPKLTDAVSLCVHVPNEQEISCVEIMPMIPPMAELFFQQRGQFCMELSTPSPLAPPFLVKTIICDLRKETAGCVCGGGPGYDLASLTPCSDQLSQSACLCPLGKSYLPDESTPHISLPFKTKMHVNTYWEGQAEELGRSLLLGLCEGRHATLESQVPGRPHT